VLRHDLLSIALAGALTFGASSAQAAACSPLKLLTSLDFKVVSPGRPGVDVQVAGRTYTFMIDTGGVTGTLSREAVASMGLKMRNAYNYVIVNVNGKQMGQTVLAPSFDVGAVHKDETLLFVDDTTPLAGSPGHYEGSLAPDFLRDYDADFDFPHGKFNLFSQDHCSGKVVYWQAPAVASIPFDTDRAGHVMFNVELDGKRVRAMLDTGTANTNLNLVTARRLFGVDIDAPDVDKVGELKGSYTADIYRRNFKTLSIAGVTISNPSLELMPDMVTRTGGPVSIFGVPRRPMVPGLISRREPELPSVVLGMSVLKMLHIYIAYGEHRLYITAAEQPPSPAAG
jgi:predicted aspartyl protease